VEQVVEEMVTDLVERHQMVIQEIHLLVALTSVVEVVEELMDVEQDLVVAQE
jgi:hypothetical protein